jgi:hypothetical protein
MNRLEFRRPRRRFSPRVEALEDRCVLNAHIIGLGQIETTGSTNRVVIEDNGTNIRVFFDNNQFPGFTFQEGTPISVTAKQAKSTNRVFYYVLGDTPGLLPSGRVINNASLDVDFGGGTGSLLAEVVSTFPPNFFAATSGNLQPAGNLEDLSTLNITVHGDGSTNVRFASQDIGANAILTIKDTTGKGSNQFAMLMGGVQRFASQVNVTYFGGEGPEQVGVLDGQTIEQGAMDNFNLDGGFGKTDTVGLFYSGVLHGSLTVNVTGGSRVGGVGKPPPCNLAVVATLFFGSDGTFKATEAPGDGNNTLVGIIHKNPNDSPTATGFANGLRGTNTGTFTLDSPTSVNFDHPGVTNANIVP